MRVYTKHKKKFFCYLFIVTNKITLIFAFYLPLQKYTNGLNNFFTRFVDKSQNERSYMLINSINMCFMGKPKKNLGDIGALKPLDLDGVPVDSRRESIKRFNNCSNDKNTDSLVLSCCQRASELAEGRVKENKNVPQDDVFQHVMCGVTKYVDDFRKENKKVSHSSLDRYMKTLAKNYEPEQDEFIRDVYPVDNRDITDILAAQEAIDKIEEILSGLTLRQEYVIREKFGFNGDIPTYKEMGKRLGVSDSRIRNLNVNGQKRLKHTKASKDLKEIQESIDNAKPIFSTTKDWKIKIIPLNDWSVLKKML